MILDIPEPRHAESHIPEGIKDVWTHSLLGTLGPGTLWLTLIAKLCSFLSVRLRMCPDCNCVCCWSVWYLLSLLRLRLRLLCLDNESNCCTAHGSDHQQPDHGERFPAEEGRKETGRRSDNRCQACMKLAKAGVEMLTQQNLKTQPTPS